MWSQFRKITSHKNSLRRTKSKCLFRDFGCFYVLEPIDQEYVIADIILDFDTAFWDNENNAYENMVDQFKNIYGYNRVDNVMSFDY